MGQMQAKKSLGQNFLIDESIILKIADAISANEDDLIIEIGPGMGALTKKIKLKNANLVCYEIDLDLKKYLDPLEDSKTKIIYQDILQSDLEEVIKNIKHNKLYIVGNLPYYITTPIIKHLIKYEKYITEMYFMVQDEVANRFTALPHHKDYGSITLFLQYFFKVEKLFTVSKNSFRPVPKVESAIIKFTKRSDRPVVNEELYFKLISDSFRLKRKTLKNNLSSYDFNKIKKILLENNYNENTRAEEIEEKVFVAICNNLERKI